MNQVNQPAQALKGKKKNKNPKNELYVRSRVLEETDTRGNKIRTLCRITVEWSPNLKEEDHKKMDHIYLNAVEDVRAVLDP